MSAHFGQSKLEATDESISTDEIFCDFVSFGADNLRPVDEKNIDQAV
jgi:hypothetical protein